MGCEMLQRVTNALRLHVESDSYGQISFTLVDKEYTHGSKEGI